MHFTDWTKRQAEGGLIVVAAVVILYAVLSLARLAPPSAPLIPWSDERGGPVVAEFSGSEGVGGIYFLPEGATVAELLRAAGVTDLRPFARAALSHRLKRGEKITATPDHRLGAEPMDAAARIHFGVPLDVNTASFAELVLVPGIGETTAARILAERQRRGAFMQMEGLMRVKGIKEKKLAELRRYLIVASGPPR
jgi:competence protein ComEA